MGRIARVLEEEEREKRGRGQANEKGGEERREATKTMRRKLDGVREKAQKEGEGANEREWVSGKEREKLQMQSACRRIPRKGNVAAHRRDKGDRR